MKNTRRKHPERNEDRHREVGRPGVSKAKPTGNRIPRHGRQRKKSAEQIEGTTSWALHEVTTPRGTATENQRRGKPTERAWADVSISSWMLQRPFPGRTLYQDRAGGSPGLQAPPSHCTESGADSCLTSQQIRILSFGLHFKSI